MNLFYIMLAVISRRESNRLNHKDYNAQEKNSEVANFSELGYGVCCSDITCYGIKMRNLYYCPRNPPLRRSDSSCQHCTHLLDALAGVAN